MRKDKNNRESSTDFIKGQIRLLNGVVLLSVTIVFVMVLKFLYDLYTFLPMYSILALLGIVVMLSIIGMFVVRKIAGKAILAIETYNIKLSKLLSVSHQIQRVEHSDLVLEKLVDISRGLSNADIASLCLVKDGTTVVRSIREDDKADGDTYRSIYYEDAVEWALNRNEIFLSDEMDEMLDSPDEETVVCVVPISSGNKMLGALQLVKHDNGGFMMEEIGAVRYFIEQSVMAYENTKVHEDERNFEIHVTNLLVSAMENHAKKRGHSKNVAMYSLQIADEINMPEGQKANLYKAALLHDIGALKLSRNPHNEEYLEHSKLGYELLRPISIYSDISRAVLHHHEWYDGGGYPYGLKGKDIPVESRIIGLAEAFDTILASNKTSSTSDFNKNLFPSNDELKHALSQIVRHSGVKFDPSMVKALLNRIDDESLCEKSENSQFMYEMAI